MVGETGPGGRVLPGPGPGSASEYRVRVGGPCYTWCMTDENGGVNIEVPAARITLEEVFGRQFEKMDMGRLYRVAEGEMIQFGNFPWPEWRREIGQLARHYYNVRRAAADAKEARTARNVSAICAAVSAAAAVLALIFSLALK